MRALAAALLLGLACCAPAAAQQRSDEPSPALRCLQHEAGPEAQPEYPRELYNANRGGRVQVELRFEGPDRAPAARVLLHEGDEALVTSVRQHLLGLRVPCLPAGSEAVLLRREYEFARDQRRVHWTRGQDITPLDTGTPWGCLERADKQAQPTYPERARRDGVQGRVVLRLTFEQPDTPPRIESFARERAELLKRASAHWAQGWRLPCLGARPISTLMTFIYSLEGDRYGFRELNLLQLLKLTRGIREQTFQADTGTMGCPFELRFLYQRPLLPNMVGEPGDPVPARRPLLEWLEQAELELPAASLDAVWGAHVKLAVPCVNIDLKPKEKS